MEDESQSQSQPLITDVPRFAGGFSILLIHDDTMTLVNLTTLLEKYSFKVTGTCDTSVAASMIREDEGRFKMIMTKVNMPGVDTVSFVDLVLGKGIPVIFMYSGGFDDVTDDKALASGSCYFIEEPIWLADLKCIWQDMYQSKLYKESQTEGSQPQHTNITEVDGERNHCKVKVKGKRTVDHNQTMAAGSLVDTTHGKRNHRDDGGIVMKEKRIDTNTNTTRSRPRSWLWNSVPLMNNSFSRHSFLSERKRLWTSDLHLKFEEAVLHLGDNARPKSILHRMNDASLTIRQVASHFQKYKSRMKRTENGSSKSDSAPVNTSSCSSDRAQFPSPPEGSSIGTQGLPAAELDIVNSTVVRQEQLSAPATDDLDHLRLIKMLAEVDSDTFDYWFANGTPPPYEIDEYTVMLKTVLDSLTPPEFGN